MTKLYITLRGVDLNKISKNNQATRKEIIDNEITKSAKFLIGRYEEITAPFETEFEFEVVKTGEWEYNIRPKEYDIERTTATGGNVNSWVLFNTLDLGSEGAKRVLLPKDFENETFPNSTETRSASYDRGNIAAIFNKEGKDMEPRDWSTTLSFEYVEEYLGSDNKLEKAIAAALRKSVV